MLRTAGFEVIDLGIDVPASRFVSAAVDAGADIIAACALMTTTMPQQREVIEHLAATGRRDDFFVMVGGASTTPAWAQEIGADGYGETAADAVSSGRATSSRQRRGADDADATSRSTGARRPGRSAREKDFDLKRYIPAVRALVKKHGITYDPSTPVPSDDDLVERVWQAGRELFLQVGVYCVDTERVITFDPIELDQALAHAPRPVVLGTGQHAKTIPVRRPESARSGRSSRSAPAAPA